MPQREKIKSINSWRKLQLFLYNWHWRLLPDILNDTSPSRNPCLHRTDKYNLHINPIYTAACKLLFHPVYQSWFWITNHFNLFFLTDIFSLHENLYDSQIHCALTLWRSFITVTSSLSFASTRALSQTFLRQMANFLLSSEEIQTLDYANLLSQR